MSPNRVLTHTVLPQTLCSFFFPLTPFYPQTTPPFSASSVLQWNNSSSGATHVRNIFTVSAGLLRVIGDGYWVVGVRRSVKFILAFAPENCINLPPTWEKTAPVLLINGPLHLS